MSTKDFFRAGVGLAVPLFGALYLAGCGGTATFRGGDGGESSIGGASSGGPGAAGRMNTAGAPNPSGGNGPVCDLACSAIACGPGSISVWDGCCSVCSPAGTGGVGSGGTSGSAGSGFGLAGACGVTACPLIACGSGSILETQPGQCCPSCIPVGDGGAGGYQQTAGAGGAESIAGGPSAGSGGANQCGGVLCPAVKCASGYVALTQAGECCPTCVADAQACTAGQQGYQSLRASLLQQSGATGCAVDTDCTILGGDVQCDEACLTSAVNASFEPNMANQLSLWASNYCSACTPLYPPCAVSPTPFCSAGQCQLYHAL